MPLARGSREVTQLARRDAACVEAAYIYIYISTVRSDLYWKMEEMVDGSIEHLSVDCCIARVDEMPDSSFEE